jgi:hypothetical protein
MAEVLTTTRGGKKIALDGYLYRLNTKKGPKEYFKCERGCRSTIVLEYDEFTQVSGKHSHPPDHMKIKRAKVKATLKAVVGSSTTTPVTSVYRNVMKTTATTEERAMEMPPYEAVKSTMYRERMRHRPLLPRCLNDIVIPAVYTKTVRGDHFLLVNDSTEDRIMVFSTALNVQRLCSSATAFMDGTFAACPSLFCELYVLHGEFMSETFPAAFALLPNRTAAVYRRLFRALNTVASSQGAALNPPTLMLDFEASTLNVLQEFYPDSKIAGCLFHFGQSLWRKIQSLGLEPAIRDSDDAKKWFRRLCALPLVPTDHIDDAFLWIQEDAPEIPGISRMHDYMVDTWVDDSARFHRSIWNHFETGRHRTNNCSEAFNSKINSMLSKKHPNVFKLIEMLQDLEDEYFKRQMMLIAGHPPRPRKKAYISADTKIERLKTQLRTGERTLQSYVDAIKHVIKVV